MNLNKSLIILILTGIIISGISCNSGNKEQKIAEIDSLITLANELTATIDSIAFDSVEIFYKSIQDQNKIFKVKLNGLPENISTRDMLFAYGNVEKGFKKLPSKLKSLTSEIETSILQLNNLKYDIHHDLMEEEEYKSYISEETGIMDRLSLETPQICRTLSTHIKNFYLLKPKVEIFLDSLKNTEDKI